MRVRFSRGKQRKFIDRVLERIMAPSLRKLKQYGIDANYQTLKSYYNENRTLPLELFEDLCKLAGVREIRDFPEHPENQNVKQGFLEIDKHSVKFKLLNDNWGRVKGGKK